MLYRLLHSEITHACTNAFTHVYTQAGDSELESAEARTVAAEKRVHELELELGWPMASDRDACHLWIARCMCTQSSLHSDWTVTMVTLRSECALLYSDWAVTGQ